MYSTRHTFLPSPSMLSLRKTLLEVIILDFCFLQATVQRGVWTHIECRYTHREIWFASRLDFPYSSSYFLEKCNSSLEGFFLRPRNLRDNQRQIICNRWCVASYIWLSNSILQYSCFKKCYCHSVEIYLAIVQVYFICSEKQWRTSLCSFLLINSSIREVRRISTMRRNFLLSTAHRNCYNCLHYS